MSRKGCPNKVKTGAATGIARRLSPIVCAGCNTQFQPKRRTTKVCSYKCLGVINGLRQLKPGKFHWWKAKDGYIHGKARMADGAIVRTRYHRKVMEEHIGRPLFEHEVVHHINGVRDDNRIENLELMTSGEHSSHHNKDRIPKRGHKLQLSVFERERRRQHAKQRQPQLRAAQIAARMAIQSKAQLEREKQQ